MNFCLGRLSRPDGLSPPPGVRLEPCPVVQGDRTEKEGLSLPGIQSCRWPLAVVRAIDYRKYRKRIVYRHTQVRWLPAGSEMVKTVCPGHPFW